MTKTQRLRRARNRRWYRKNHDRAKQLARGYSRRDREVRKVRCAKWRENQRAKNPSFARDSTRAFREANPNYTRDRYHARKFKRLFFHWATVCATNRRAREERESAT